MIYKSQLATIGETCLAASLCLTHYSNQGWISKVAWNSKSPKTISANRRPSQLSSSSLWLGKAKAHTRVVKNSQISLLLRISKSITLMRRLRVMAMELPRKCHSRHMERRVDIISTHLSLIPIWSNCTCDQHSSTNFHCNSTSAIWSKLSIWTTNWANWKKKNCQSLSANKRKSIMKKQIKDLTPRKIGRSWLGPSATTKETRSCASSSTNRWRGTS